ncbi:MAG: ABC transporter permease [Deltaproteobacteria bacterium]|nr:ABC transporter permease [Deltaproteobacteria bacterium]
MYFQLAWRNIWRNPRRTIVILTAVIIGVWSMIFLGALMRGMEVEMIRNSLKTLTGNIQIHEKNYRDDPVVENSMTDPALLEKALKIALPEGANWAMRVRVNAMASNARHSSGVTLVGIDPAKEARISFIGKAVTNGRYLKTEDTNKILVGQALLDKFDAKIEHKLVLMTQDMDQEIASKAFRIVGVFRAEMEATEKEFVFATLSQAQKMLKLKNSISEVAIALKEQNLDGGEEKTVSDNLSSILPATVCKVETWQELLPMMREYLKLFDNFIYIWHFVVFIAMGFGIVNTTLMAIFERMREFGLLKALGMKPLWIVRGVITESLFLLILGIVAGNITGIISVMLIDRIGIDLSALAAGVEMWGMPRILYPELWTVDVVVANLVVLLLGLLVSIYPAVKAARFTPVEALVKI